MMTHTTFDMIVNLKFKIYLCFIYIQHFRILKNGFQDKFAYGVVE